MAPERKLTKQEKAALKAEKAEQKAQEKRWKKARKTWPRLSHDAMGRHRARFDAINTTNDGYLDGGDVVRVLMDAGLPRDMLKHIWDLADDDGDGRMSFPEFVVAMYLVERASAGTPPPTSLYELPPDTFPRMSRPERPTTTTTTTEVPASEIMVMDDDDDVTAKVLKDRRSPRERGRMGSSVITRRRDDFRTATRSKLRRGATEATGGARPARAAVVAIAGVSGWTKFPGRGRDASRAGGCARRRSRWREGGEASLTRTPARRDQTFRRRASAVLKVYRSVERGRDEMLKPSAG